MNKAYSLKSENMPETTELQVIIHGKTSEKSVFLMDFLNKRKCWSWGNGCKVLDLQAYDPEWASQNPHRNQTWLYVCKSSIGSGAKRQNTPYSTLTRNQLTPSLGRDLVSKNERESN